MIFKKRYIFETRQTRYWRYLKNIFIIMLTSSIFYLAACPFFVIRSREESVKSQEAFYRRPPELIVVFTGDQGRIPYAIKKAKIYKQPHIFITGVYSQNSVKTLLQGLKLGDDLDSKLFEIDYAAGNTVENVLSTLRHLRKHQSINNILIVSHDYHILRIKLILKKLSPQHLKYNYYFDGYHTDYKSFRNVKILFKEIFKYMRTYLFLAMWDKELDIRTKFSQQK